MEAGLPPLELDESLAHIARAHAEEMAELNYFSHSSPRAENTTLARRAANAGSFAKDLGENLALVGKTDTASRGVEAWLESPGHRANLLSPEFTHVGFGTAPFPDGRIVIAQEFSLTPAVLKEATLRPRAGVQLDVLLELNQETEVAVFFAGTSSRAVTLGAGPQLLHIPLSRVPELPLGVEVGLRPVGSSGAFSLQSEGTLTPEGWTGSTPSGNAPENGAKLVNASLILLGSEGYTAQLTFGGPLRFTLTAWQQGVRLPVTMNGNILTVALTDALSPLNLGVPQADGRYRVLYSLRPRYGSLTELVPTPD